VWREREKEEGVYDSVGSVERERKRREYTTQWISIGKANPRV